MSSPHSARPLPRRIVIATRESALALWQARHVESRLASLYPALEVVILGMTTEGDRRLGTSLAKIGGKGLFVKELEEALARGEADIAVHSLKDVPMTLLPGHVLAAFPERADPHDAFVSLAHAELDALPPGARVGTSSLRRESQLRELRPDLTILPLRGNVTTRLRKLDDGAYDAVILAAAGLERLGLAGRIRSRLPLERCLPAAGQGALAIECRAERDDLLRLLAPLHHEPTALCVKAERLVARLLAASCTVPLGVHAEFDGPQMWLRSFVGAPDGRCTVRAECRGAAAEIEALGQALVAKLRAKGADAILAAVDPARAGAPAAGTPG
jgi:hydroxymethylbilane synthase